jgi:CMP-2-keto-3-deoxyoctulosonic acid synthetase
MPRDDGDRREPFWLRVHASNPNNVKVVTALGWQALYFSRSLVPFNRDVASFRLASS